MKPFMKHSISAAGIASVMAYGLLGAAGGGCANAADEALSEPGQFFVQ